MKSLPLPWRRQKNRAVPLVVPVFNQLTFLRNIVNWYQYFSPDEIWIVDNGSDYSPLLDWYDRVQGDAQIHVVRCIENKSLENLRALLDDVIHERFDYYAISDPDIMPHPSVPLDFVSVLQACVEKHGYHHAGLALKIDDLPAYFERREQVLRNEEPFWETRVEIPVNGNKYVGYVAPLDTTFAVFSSATGWEAPMRQKWWDSSVRMFEAFHLGWYLDANNLSDEMINYFRSCKQAMPGEPSALRNNYRPARFEEAESTA